MEIPTRSLRKFDCRYHRNGVGGNGFFACSFTWGKDQFLATVFDEPGNVAVLNLSHPITSRWRGDQFEPALRDQISQFGDMAYDHSNEVTA